MSALVLEQVSVRAGNRQLLGELSLTLEPGQFLALVGPNGAGKTTLLRVALGLLRPSQGRVSLGGRDLRRMNPRERAARIGWLPQHQAPSEGLSVTELVGAARYRFDEPKSISDREAAAALERVGAAGLGGARVSELSGGERQRVFLASLLAQGPRLALLDEPASHLDPAHQLETYRLLGELWALGMGILLVTHDVNLIGQLGAPERIVLLGLDRGREVFRARFMDSDLPARLGSLFGLDFSVVQLDGRRILVPELPRPPEARREP